MQYNHPAFIELLRKQRHAVWPEKAEIENDENVMNFIDALFRNNYWDVLLNFLMSNKATGFYYLNKKLELDKIRNLLEQLFHTNSIFFKEYPLRYSNQFIRFQDYYDIILDFLKELRDSNLLKDEYEVLHYCPTCKYFEIVPLENSKRKKTHGDGCNTEFIKIFHCSLLDNIYKALDNGQFLELYIKRVVEQLKDKYPSQISLVSVNSENYNNVSTSIEYSFGSKIEIDFSALIKNKFFIFEARNTRVTQNTIDQKLGKLARFIKYLNTKGIQDFQVVFWIVSTHKVSLETASKEIAEYYDWLTYFEKTDGENLLNLKNELEKYVTR